MRLRVGGCSDLYHNKLVASEKKKEEYIKFLVIQQNYSKRCTNGFMFKVLYQGLSFYLEL